MYMLIDWFGLRKRKSLYFSYIEEGHLVTRPRGILRVALYWTIQPLVKSTRDWVIQSRCVRYGIMTPEGAFNNISIRGGKERRWISPNLTFPYTFIIIVDFSYTFIIKAYKPLKLGVFCFVLIYRQCISVLRGNQTTPNIKQSLLRKERR